MEPHVYPWKVTIDPPQVEPGGMARIKVELTGTTNENLAVGIAANPSVFFTNLPTSVTITAGNDEVSFDATVSSGQEGPCMVTASCSGHMAAGACVCETTMEGKR